MSGISRGYDKATQHDVKAKAALEVAAMGRGEPHSDEALATIAVAHALLEVAEHLSTIRWHLETISNHLRQ